LSMRQFCQLYHSIFGSKDGEIITAETASIMTNNGYGLFSKFYNVAAGTQTYYHEGIFFYDLQGCYAIWFQLPDGLTCAFFVNAADKPGAVPSTNQSLYNYLDTVYTAALTQLSK
jgi:hypothetical protein